MKKSNYFLLSFLILPLFSLGQHDLTLYQMERVPQRFSVNPAFMPESNAYLGLPFFSEMKFSISQPFKYSQIFEVDAKDSLEFKAESFLKAFSKNNRIHTDINFSIFSFGTKISKGRYFINFSLKEKITQDISLPDKLFSLLWYGNGSSQFLGKKTEFNPLMRGTVYDEWALGFAGSALKNRLSYGITAKYLSGRINVKSKKADFSFYTDPEFYEIYVSSDIEILTSGIDNSDNYFDQPTGSIIFPGNYGFGIDIGAAYRINEKISVSASMIDLGYIKWKTGTMSYVSKEPGAEFIYKGMTIGDFVEIFTDFESFGQKLSDSIIDLVKLDSVPGIKYTSGIPVKFNAGVSYLIDDKSSVNLLLHGMSCNKHFYPAISASYTFNWTKALALNISYNIFNHQYTNVGGGFTLNAGPIQLYLVSDNLPGLIFYKSTNNTSFQFGLNFVFNKQHSSGVQTIDEPIVN